MARAKQPVSVNGLEFDALIEESLLLEATVPEYAVEKGFSVSDAVIIGSDKLEMILFVSSSPVTWAGRFEEDSDRVGSVCSQLKEMYFDREVVTVETTDDTYTDMVIKSLNIKKTVESGYAREIPISFQKINVTEAETTDIPDSYGKSGETGASAGSANTSEEVSADAGSDAADGTENGSGLGSSILYGASKKIKGFLGGEQG